MKPSIAAKLASLDSRLKEIDARLADPSVTNDLDNYRKLSQERSEIEPVVAAFNEWRRAEGDIAAAEEMARDPDMKSFAEDEIKAGRARLEALEVELQKMLLPRDPNDEKNLFLEIRAGTGGDEAALFAAELFRMYTRYAERMRWKVEIVDRDDTGIGGIKTITALIEGETGELLPPGDVAAWTRAIDDLVADDARRIRFGHAARRFAMRFEKKDVGWRLAGVSELK